MALPMARLGACIFGFSLSLSSIAAFAQERLLVFAPASLGAVMKEVGAAYSRAGDARPVFSVAGTAQLARQVAAGVPADIFISADKRWMDYVVSKGAAAPHEVRAFLGNSLVLAVRRETENWADGKGLLTDARFAMGNPQSVPAGTYAQSALEAKGWWETAKPNAVYTENVRVAVKWLTRGEVGAALVYGSDVASEPDLRAALTFDEKEHGTIRYYVALVGDTPSEKARDFAGFLSSAAAQALFVEAGFSRLPETATD
ncbi:MAG: molybdate ABC transporter substrate-binding protein [Pseudomonadota bacterium]